MNADEREEPAKISLRDLAPLRVTPRRALDGRLERSRAPVARVNPFDHRATTARMSRPPNGGSRGSSVEAADRAGMLKRTPRQPLPRPSPAPLAPAAAPPRPSPAPIPFITSPHRAR